MRAGVVGSLLVCAFAGAQPNIADWCDPANSDGSGNNPACVNGARCLVRGASDGMCVVFGCNVDLPTGAANEDSCRSDFGTAYACVDLDTAHGDELEPYDATTSPSGQNAEVTDNVCVAKCAPRLGGNDCAAPFACQPDSTRYNLGSSICFAVGCQGGDDCPVTVSGPETCTGPGDCDTAAGEFCVVSVDTDGDGVADAGACAVAGVCDSARGLCAAWD